MGKALLLICSGLVILFGLIQVDVQKRQGDMIKRSATAANTAQARNMAHEGVDIAIQKLESNPGFRNNYQPWQVTLDHGTASVQFIDYTTDDSLTYRQLILVSKSGLDNDSAKVVTKIEKNGGMPKVPSAMGFYTSTINFNANGSSFLINGNDTKIDGTAGYGNSKSGITVNSTDAQTTITDAMNSNQENKVTGKGNYTPNILYNSSLTNTALKNNISNYVAEADTTYYAGSYTGTQFGTASNPQITIIDGDMTVGGTSGGYGIMIVKNASSLKFGGTFTFHGLIYMEGGMLQGSGHIYLYGSLQFGASTSTNFSGATVNGDVHLNYSTQAFQEVENGMPKKFNIRYVKLKSYE
ncbi:MAG TPA: hypothetical protein VKA34_09565 [Balneolales bacterium]|nr:hypothetical protein [Balneolales bacterium]